jgi:hypothetical protein
MSEGRGRSRAFGSSAFDDHDLGGFGGFGGFGEHLNSARTAESRAVFSIFLIG